VSRIRELLASLAPHKRPRHIVLRDEPLPRTAAGKLRRGELADWASEAVRA
jgi:acyl-coenzyme A synthetase/AMP-(fatty) acid ligase